MKPRTIRAQAYGRVNLIGEHTDYNEGFVLPTSIPQLTTVTLRLRSDRWVEIRSFEKSDFPRYELGHEQVRRHWSDYIQGVTAVLAEENFELSGFECEVHSTVPIGSGLSSSAALEVSLLKALREAFALPLDDIQIARLGQKAENNFVGARVGIMDQMVCSLGHWGEALFIDTRDLHVTRLALPLHEMDLVVINSGIHHSNVQGEYNQRRRECEEACRHLDVPSLREVSDVRRLTALPDVLERRARHVVSENNRVLEAVDALIAKDFLRLGSLFVQSHQSMRDDYEVSVPEVDLLVELAMSHPLTFGARLTGGGFGGSIVAITRPGGGLEMSEWVRTEFFRRSGCQATVLIPDQATPPRKQPQISH